MKLNFALSARHNLPMLELVGETAFERGWIDSIEKTSFRALKTGSSADDSIYLYQQPGPVKEGE